MFAFKKPFTSRGFDTWSRYVFTLYYVRGRARARERERERERENDGFFLGGGAGGEVCVGLCLCWFVHAQDSEESEEEGRVHSRSIDTVQRPGRLQSYGVNIEGL